MWELIALPFRVAWSVLSAAWDICWGLLSLVFGLIGGVFSLCLGVAVAVALGWLAVQAPRRTPPKKEEDFISYYDQDGVK